MQMVPLKPRESGNVWMIYLCVFLWGGDLCIFYPPQTYNVGDVVVSMFVRPSVRPSVIILSPEQILKTIFTFFVKLKNYV